LGDEAGLAAAGMEPLDVERAGGALSSKFMYGGEATTSLERGLAIAVERSTRRRHSPALQRIWRAST
jgi:hypothetical protein